MKAFMSMMTTDGLLLIVFKHTGKIITIYDFNLFGDEEDIFDDLDHLNADISNGNIYSLMYSKGNTIFEPIYENDENDIVNSIVKSDEDIQDITNVLYMFENSKRLTQDEIDKLYLVTRQVDNEIHVSIASDDISDGMKRTNKGSRSRSRKFKSFDGTPWFNLSALHYLNNKYKNHCVIIPNKKKPYEHTDVSIRWIQKKNKEGYLHVPKNFWSEFNKHLSHKDDKRLIVFPFGFTCLKSGGHANMLIYDLHTKTMERFDSAGVSYSGCLGNTTVDKQIQKLFIDKMGHGFIKKYLKPFTKHKIFQELQEAEKIKRIPSDPKYGFCSVWACWWSDLRMMNPDIKREKLIEYTLKKFKKLNLSLTEYIRNYSQYIVEHSEVTKKCLRK